MVGAEQKSIAISKAWQVVRTHTDSYTGGKVCLSSDESFVVCWCAEKIKLLDLESGLVRHEFVREDDGFACFALSPDSTELATAQKSGLIRVWSIESGECLREWRGHDLPITCVTFDASGTMLATGSVDRSVR